MSLAVNRVVLAAGQRLLVWPDKQTFAVSDGMSQTSQKQTAPARANFIA
jgi:hypothetical protein